MIVDGGEGAWVRGLRRLRTAGISGFRGSLVGVPLVRARLSCVRQRSGRVRRLSGGQRFQDGVERFLLAIGEVAVGLGDIVEAGVETDDRDCDVAQAGKVAGRAGGFRRGQMVVLERGMAFDESLEQLRAKGLHYLVASRRSEQTRWLAEFETLEGFDEVIRMPSPRNPR